MRHRIVSLRLLAATLLLLTAVLVGGVRFYHTQQQLLQSEAEDELQAIADLKVNQIAAWRAERLADAGVLSRNSLVVEEVTAFFANPQATSQQERLLDRFQDLVDLYHYADVILVDPEGEVRLAQSGSLAPLDPEALRFIAEALRTRQPVLTTLHQNTADPEPHIATVAPLFASDDPAAPAVGAIILRSDATQFLFPLIQSWPLSSTSAETLIVRRDGDAVLFLNELRHQSGTALNLRIPLTETNVPAVMAVLGEEGIVSGLDYRGVEVLSVLRAIPDSDWYMVAKIDTAEVLADWITRSRLIIALMVGAVAILGLAGWSTWQGYEKTNLQRLYQEEKARQESEARYHTTLFSIGDGVIVTDSQARVTLLNPVAEALTGWTQAEAIGRPLEEIFVIVNEETRAPVESPVERVLQEGVIVGLANHTLLLARDGREIPIADSGAPIHAGAGEISGVVLVIRDQTDERAAQMKLAASEQRYRSFFENNRAVMLLVDPETAQIMDANPAAALYYGWDHETLCSMRIDEINTLSTEEVLSEMAAARAEKRSQFLFRHHRADGTIRDVEVYSVAVTLEGRQLLYSIVHDVTDRLEAERQVRLNESRLQSLFRISQHDAEDIQTLLDYALAEALQLTESQFGYIYHYDEDKRRFILNTWSGGVMDECTVIEPQTEYDLDLTGLWGEVVRQRKPILVNDFQESQPLKKGYPEGHVALHKYLSVPVFRGEQIVAVVGMANKTTDYNQTDIWQLSLLMDSVWKIVDRKRAEEALRASEALNRTILDNLPVGIAMSDADPAGKASYMNDNFVRLYRTTREAVVDRDTFWEAAYEDPEFREVMKQRIMADITSGDPARMYWEAIPITREGEETTYISARNTPIKGTALMLSTVWDITELRRSELEREEEHNLTRALRDTAAALITAPDLKAIMTIVLENVTRVVPHDAANIMLVEDDDVRMLYHRGYTPERAAGMEAFSLRLSEIPHFRTAFSTREPLLVSRTDTDPDWVHNDITDWVRSYIAVPIQSHDQVIGFLNLDSTTPGFFTERHIERLHGFANLVSIAIEQAQLYEQIQRQKDELEQRVIERTAQLNHSKERIEAILNSSSDVIILCRVDGSIDQVNPAFYTTFQCAIDAAYNQPLTRLVRPDDSSMMERAFARVLETRQPERVEATVHCGGHANFEADIMLSPMVEPEGDLLGVVCSVRDVTERRRMEEQLRQTLAHEMELGELKSRYLSMAAHDLRNPLAIIQNATTMLERYYEKLSEEKRLEKFSHIRASIKIMVDLLDDILTIGRVETGKLEFQPTLINLPEFCKTLVAEQVQATDGKRTILLYHTNVDNTAYIDPKLLRYALSNLLSNALKYSPAESTVELHVTGQADEIVFEVRDSGIGIPAENQKRLFEIFHRADNVGDVPGTGVGLAIVKQSVELHGGTVAFESTEGTGSTFTITLPQVPEEF